MELATVAALADALNVEFEHLALEHMAPSLAADEIDRFASSHWGKALEISTEETVWLRMLPASFWDSITATPEVMAEFIQARRRAIEKSRRVGQPAKKRRHKAKRP